MCFQFSCKSQTYKKIILFHFVLSEFVYCVTAIVSLNAMHVHNAHEHIRLKCTDKFMLQYFFSFFFQFLFFGFWFYYNCYFVIYSILNVFFDIRCPLRGEIVEQTNRKQTTLSIKATKQQQHKQKGTKIVNQN